MAIPSTGPKQKVAERLMDGPNQQWGDKKSAGVVAFGHQTMHDTRQLNTLNRTNLRAAKNCGHPEESPESEFMAD